MAKSLQIKKLKKIIYLVLRWRLQLPNYYPHNPIPPDDELTEFSRGVKCACRDLLREVEKIEGIENQRRLYGRRDGDAVYGDESYLDEIRGY